MTACRRPTVYPAMLLLGLFVAVATSWNVTTIDGRKFAWFVSLGTWTILGLGLLQLLQGLALWNTARSQLKRRSSHGQENRIVNTIAG